MWRINKSSRSGFVLLVFLFAALPILNVQILRFVSVGILIFSGFAIVQTMPIIEDLFNDKKISISSELASTLSNKNFFSEVLVLLLPASFFALLSDEKRFKVLHLIAFILASFYILILASLSCWLAVAVALFVVGLAFLFGRSTKVAAGKKKFFCGNRPRSWGDRFGYCHLSKISRWTKSEI
ncbi:MAG: hypothetical protein IPN88_19015 [Bacteroidetes bacterium]|nr:hypothetical protein [Bacteroidota bacterium]